VAMFFIKKRLILYGAADVAMNGLKTKGLINKLEEKG
jgi:hypothetical protein